MSSTSIQKDQLEDLFPMSDISFGMVYHSLQDPDGAFYHDQIVFNIRISEFDEHTFYTAVLAVMDKHANLRSNFNVFDFETPVQLVFRKLQPDFRHQDLSELKEEQQEQLVQEFMEADKRHHFSLATAAPLWRIRTFLLEKNRLLVIWINHHAVVDGWSTSMVMKDLHDVYTCLRKGISSPLAGLKSSYKDYVLRELAAKRDEKLKAFWAGYLSGSERLKLPGLLRDGDILRNASFSCEPGLHRQLREAANRQGVKFKHICFAAYVYSIYMITHQTDLIVGLISHNRPVLEDGDKIVGCFLNTVPFRIQWQEGMTWGAYVSRIDQQLLELKKYEGLSYREINGIPGLNDRKTESLVNTFFNYMDFYVYKEIHTSGDEPATDPVTRRSINISSYEKTNTCLDFMLDAGSERFNLVIRYYESVISSSMAAALGDYFFEALRQIVSGPEQLCRKESLLDEAARTLLFTTFNDTNREYPSDRTLPDLFRDQVKRTPGFPAVLAGDRSLSYSQLDDRSAQLAEHILRCGIRPGSVVAVYMRRCPEMMIGIFGVLKAGAVYLPIDPALPAGRIQYLLNDSGASLLLVGDDLREGLAWDKCIVDMRDGDLYSRRLEGVRPEILPGDPAYIIYTSGSTGRPKGVIVEHGALVNRIHWMQRAYPLSTSDRLLQKTSVGFDVSVWELCWWSIAGAALVLLPPGGEGDPGALAAAVREQDVSVLHFVPSMLDAFLDALSATAGTLTSLRRIFSSGEALKPETVRRCHQLLQRCELVNLYGPTEATIDVTYYDCLDQREDGIVPIGRPIDNCQAYVLNKYLEFQPVGVAGDLYLAGTGLAIGYLNQPSLTDMRFIVFRSGKSIRLYKTGDIARWLPDGNLEYLGRDDDQVKIRGFRIELGEVEKVLMEHPGISDVIVTCSSNGSVTQLNAFIIGEGKPSLADMQAFMGTKVPAYMIPAHFYQLEQFPLKSNGKVDRPQLLLHAKKIAAGGPFRGPQNNGERTIAGIWSKVLGGETPGVHDNFFQIGGDSISILKVYGQLNRAFDKKIAVVDLFRYTTISSLANYYSQENEPSEEMEDYEESLSLLLDTTKSFEENE